MHVDTGCLALRDGARVCLRPLEPDDRSAVEEVFASLSERSRSERFHGPKPRLADADLRQLLAVDHQDHEAVLAVEEASGRALGIARFVRDRWEPDVAEIAFEVADDWHGRGLATVLVAALSRRAARLGVARFRGLALSTNERAKSVLRRAGSVVAARLEGTAVLLVVELPRYDAPSAA